MRVGVCVRVGVVVRVCVVVRMCVGVCVFVAHDIHSPESVNGTRSAYAGRFIRSSRRATGSDTGALRNHTVVVNVRERGGRRKQKPCRTPVFAACTELEGFRGMRFSQRAQKTSLVALRRQV